MLAQEQNLVNVVWMGRLVPLEAMADVHSAVLQLPRQIRRYRARS
jgi:hypothetical protein